MGQPGRFSRTLLRGGWLSEATALAGSPVCDGYAFSRELIRELVYQEAGATRRRVVQRHLAALIRAGIADDQGEEARAPLSRTLASPFAQDAGDPHTLHPSRSATSVV